MGVKRVAAIIQARMASTRVPGKVLIPILGKPMLWYIAYRAQQASGIDDVIITTTQNPEDDVIEELADAQGWGLYRGNNVDDVVDRFYNAAQKYDIDLIVRLWGDSPLIDSEIIHRMIQETLLHKADVAVTSRQTFPEGMNLEVYTFEAMKRIYQETENPLFREYPIEYVDVSEDPFKLVVVSSDVALPHMHLTLDYPSDLNLITSVFDGLFDESKDFHLRDIVTFLSKEDAQKQFIAGSRIYLRGIKESDLECMSQWSNDSEVTQYMVMGAVPNSGPIYCSWKSVDEEYQLLQKSDMDVVFAILERKYGNVIGLIGLYDICWVPRHAELRIVIGERDCFGLGYGTEAILLVVKYAFEKLNLNKVHLGVNAENVRAIKAYKKAGFVEEGVLREHIYRNGRYYDAVMMCAIREG